MKNLVRILFIFIFFSCVFSFASHAKMKVVFINPGSESTNDSGDFWPNVNRFMMAAAEDLNVQLTSFHADRNHILMKQLVNQAISLKPDYLILVNEKEMLPHMLSQLVNTDIKVFLLLNKLSRDQQKALPKPLTNKIIGCLSPNNQEVGEKLAETLIAKASKFNKPQLKMYALLGDYNTPAAQERKKGLKRALLKHPSVTLIDSTVANWSEPSAFEKTYGVLSRYPADIIWAANDAMAFGAMAAINKLKLVDKVVVGGINWDVHPKGYQLNISYGGHVTLGAKALLMLHDYHQFPKLVGPMKQRLAIFESSESSVREAFVTLLRNQQFQKFDFTRFSAGAEKPLEFNLVNLVSTIH
ncbi:ABC transporter substrate-binding protein [Pseudoalteromonas sp.]|uniref:ABC transporter substrate-binding protein n=1 Tax=Pseudoalteromonas sp. TaxID=53249 RepID=UPI003567A44A